MPYRKLVILSIFIFGVLLVLPWISVVRGAQAAENLTSEQDDVTDLFMPISPKILAQTGTADLSVSKTVTPEHPSVGDLVTYTIEITNLGPEFASGVFLTDTLPTEVTFVNAIPPADYDPDIGWWDVGVLDVNQTLTLTIFAEVNADGLGLTVTNTAYDASSDLSDPDLTDNADTAVFTVQSTRLIGRVLDADTSQPVLGATVLVTDTLNHSYSTLTSASGWYTFTETVSQPLAAGDATVSARKTGFYQPSGAVTKNLIANQDNTQDFSLNTTDLRVTMTDGRTTVTPGQEYSYVVRVINDGTIDASDFVITDTLSQYLTIISDTLPVDYTKSGDVYTWRVTDDVPSTSGEVGPYTITVEVDSSLPGSSTSITNAVEVGTSSPEANTSNNSASDTNNASGSHNVSITLSVSPASVRTGQNATYTIRVSNSGTSSVTDVTVTDTFSQYVDVSSASTTKGSRTIDSSARRVTANVGTLDSNQSATITVVTTVNSTARTNLTVSNSASVSYRFGGSTFTKTSSSASFSLVFSTTLPGTGGIELRAKDAPPSVTTVATLSAILLIGIGIFTFIYGLRMRSRQSDWGGWALRMGLLFTFAGMLFGFAAWGFSNIPSTQSSDTSVSLLNSSVKTMTTPQLPEDPAWEGVVQNEEPSPLPDFPIPEPTHIPQDENGKTADSSPVNRIVLPSLGVDTIVKYVPFDGFSWLIAGLQEEVAWMGDTSWPGLGSNTGFAGHVTLWNGRDGPFRNLDQLQTDDPVTIYTEENQYTYQVREKTVVSDIEMSVIQPTSGSHITLITCTNWDVAASLYRDRLIVSADLVSVTPIQGAVQGN
jgi:LPXTG-site transpeptidase (sortase) family protein